MKDLVSDFARVGRFTAAASYQRFGYVVGALLVLGGLFHVLVHLVDGGPWGGPISWRKPVVFGLSFGITLLTVSWIMGFLRPRKMTGWAVIGVFAAAAVGEVFLISMQRWRGVASHFNESTPFDSMVFGIMGSLVSVVAVVLVFVVLRSFWRLDAPPSLALAIRAGLVLVLVSQAVGVQMIVEGGNTFGAAGALKVPHAVTMHAVQILPALALLLLLSESSERRRVRIVALGTTGYAALIASTLVQTYSGRGPLEVGVVSSLLAVVGLAMLLASAAVALRGLGSRLHPPARPSALSP